MAITQYGTITTDSAINVGTTRATSHTVEAGTDRLLVYIVGIEDGSAVPSQAPVFNGAPMALARSAVAGSTWCYIYFLVAPDVVTADVSISFTNNCDDFCCIAMNFSGVDQGTPLGNTASLTDAASPYDISLLISADSLMVGGCCVSSGTAAPFTPAPGLTDIGSVSNGSLGTNIALFGGYRVEGVAGTYAGGCTGSASTTATLVTAEFKAATAATGAAVDVIGVLAAPAVGVENIVVDATSTAAGVIATASAGAVAQASAAFQYPAGLTALLASGGAGVVVNGAATPSSAGATGQVGAVSPAYGAAIVAAGIGGAAQIGSIGVGPEGVAALTGVTVLGLVGAVTCIASATGTATGLTAAAIPGSVTVSATVEIAVPGYATAGEVGSLAPRFDASVPLSFSTMTVESGIPQVRGVGWSPMSPDTDTWTGIAEAESGWLAGEAAKQAWGPGQVQVTSWAELQRRQGEWVP